MSIPPYIRVALSVPEKHASTGALATFARSVRKTRKPRECSPSRETTGHTGAGAPGRSHIAPESLLTLGLSSTVDFLACLANPCSSITNSRILLANNVATVSEWRKELKPINLISKEVRIIGNRVESLLDLLSLHDAAKLMYALSQLDQRLHGTVKHLFEHVVHSCEHLELEADNNSDVAVSIALALSSLEVLARIQETNVKTDGNNNVHKLLIEKESRTLGDNVKAIPASVNGRDHIEQSNPEVATSERSGSVSERVASAHILDKKLLECIELGSGLDLKLLLLLAQMAANISVPIPNAAEAIIRSIDIEDLDEQSICGFLHACAIAMNSQQVNVDDTVQKCTWKLGKLVENQLSAFQEESIAQVFHSFYITGHMDTGVMSALANNMASKSSSLHTSRDFYRMAIPLAVTGQLSSEELCLWVLNQLAQNVDHFSEEKSQFLFLLTSIANNIKVVWKKREKLHLSSVALETDIYEKAETYLRQQEGQKAYFASPRAAMLCLIEKANSMIQTSNSDEFVQILLLNCARNFRPDSSVKFELLKQCKKRINEISREGIPQVLQTMFTLFSANSPELVELLTLYLDRIIAEIGLYIDEHALLIEGPNSLALTFLEDINLLGNMLATLDRCNLNRGDLAERVIELLECDNYKKLESSTFQGAVDLLHYLAFSLDRHDSIDIIAILIQQKLENGVHASEGQLAAIAECFIAAPLALNSHRHQKLIGLIREKANESKARSRTLQDILKRLD